MAGLTGADRPHEHELLRNALQSMFNVRETYVVNDCIIAMRAGTNKPYGAVICAGSGFYVAVKNKYGIEYIFGYYIDDEDQSGYALGKKVIRVVFAAEAGIVPPTLLTDIILDYFCIPTVDELLFKYVNRQLNIDIKHLAPLVFQAVDLGDHLAIDISL